MTDPQKTFLRTVVPFIITVGTTASIVFFLTNYINTPLNKIQLDISLLQRDISEITKAHLEYNKNALERDKAIIEIGNRLRRIEEKLGI